MSGMGKLILSHAGIFEGEFKNGKICGRGRHYDINGAIVDKEWPILSIDEFAKQVAPGVSSSRISVSEPFFRTDHAVP